MILILLLCVTNYQMYSLFISMQSKLDKLLISEVEHRSLIKSLENSLQIKNLQISLDNSISQTLNSRSEKIQGLDPEILMLSNNMRQFWVNTSLKVVLCVVVVGAQSGLPSKRFLNNK